MKRKVTLLCALGILCSLLFASVAYADGEGNIDSGGGSTGTGNSESYWSAGNDGVRVTVVRASDRTPVTRPIDLTNKRPDVVYSFGKVSKLSYTGGTALMPDTGTYEYVNPSQSLPRIISSQSYGQANIEEIKSYFTDEQVIRSIANLTGMDFDTLVSGDYRLLLEPIAYYKFQGNLIATTATEAALYDEQLSGALRSVMKSVTHQNLPLAMFLETADLGYPAWTGSQTSAATNAEIKSSLGVGVVRFNDAEAEGPEVSTYDYEYWTNTEVITSVYVSGGQSDPDNPVSVTFDGEGTSYTVSNVYYPEGDGQLAWIRWTTPEEAQTMTITVTVHGGGSTEKGTLLVKIVDLDENPPPDPNADDRNDSFTKAEVPENEENLSASWGVWRPRWHAYWVWHSGDEEDDGYWCDHGWWEFDYNQYTASISASMSITADEKSPSASDGTIKSGYGINEVVTPHVSPPPSSAVTPAQNAVTDFPEFQYQSYWRLLERMSSGYDMTHEFQENRYSTYNRRTHFTPIWYPDGTYTPYTWLIDCWTPAGMLSMNLTDSITISGNLWSDWHIAPQNPD
ncbi:MAG: hypothetical protein LUC60_01975 [Lachnospiraceae bacterium]|nr:hypothetical protein [Lachnospiraceae bacterium]